MIAALTTSDLKVINPINPAVKSKHTNTIEVNLLFVLPLLHPQELLIITSRLFYLQLSLFLSILTSPVSVMKNSGKHTLVLVPVIVYKK